MVLENFFAEMRIVLLAIIVGLFSACSNKQSELPEIVKVERVVPYHIVKEGESVGSIAEKHSMTRAELIKLNNLSMPYQLYNGQRLIINVKIQSQEVDNDEDVVVTDRTEKDEDATAETIDDVKDPTIDVVTDNATVPEKIESEYVWPITDGKSKIFQNFDSSGDGGIILRASSGTPVKAVADGIVRVARALDGDASSYGKTVVILHRSKNKLSVYSHLLEFSVKEGKSVKKGDIIGKVGKSGTATSPQLYLQILDVDIKKQTKTSIDPASVLP